MRATTENEKESTTTGTTVSDIEQQQQTSQTGFLDVSATDASNNNAADDHVLLGAGSGAGAGVSSRDNEEDDPEAPVYDDDNEDDDDDEDQDLTETGSYALMNGVMKQQQELAIARLKEKLRGKDQTRMVQNLRLTVVGILFATAILVCLGLYLYTTGKQQTEFEVAFRTHAAKLQDAFSMGVERNLEAFGSFGSILTNYAVGTEGVEFPFVTLPNFEVLATSARIQSGSPVLFWAPLVTDEKRLQWEEYALQHRFQVDHAHEEDKKLRQSQDEYFAQIQGELLEEEQQQKEGPENRRRHLQQQQQQQQQQDEDYVVSLEDRININIIDNNNGQQQPPITRVTTISNNVDQEEDYVVSGDDQNNNSNSTAHQQPVASPPRDVPIINNTVQDGSGYQYRIVIGKTNNPRPAPNNTGPYFLRWQRSPINGVKQKTLNFDLKRWGPTQEAIPALMENPKVVMSNTVRWVEPNSNFNKNLLLSQYRNNAKEYVGEPLSYFTYPVFDTFYDPMASIDYHKDHLAGVLVGMIYWRLLFRGVLPPELKGVLCILEGSANNTTIVYRVDGPTTTYLGEVDPTELYDKYRYLEFSQDATSYVKSHARPESRSYTTVPLHDDFGLYKLRVYPTRETQDQFTSNLPVVYTLVLGAVFLVTVLVFLVFNYMVEHRQKVVMNQALQSGVLLSSLFPEQVQDRLMNDNSSQGGKNHHGRRSDGGTTTSMASKVKKVVTQDLKPTWGAKGGNDSNPLMKPTNATGSSNLAMDQSDITNTQRGEDISPSPPPIADLYENATIMFADLAGFTKWSSTRSPQDVFVLLETLYNAFDMIAAKEGVFKVETIGDCYLAVCGLPEPNPNHAVVMAKFASDCMLKMSQLVRRVSDKLGAETLDLQFRVGLHTGPVTAGVLRGQKSRFQLFGDTVNTASRMESNGQPGRIHASKETADELIARGKANWVTARPDKITAKGKGELQTYFVTPTPKRATSIAKTA